MSALSPNSGNLSMPRGRVSFAFFSDVPTAAQTGEVDLGNVVSLDLTPKFEYKDHLTSRGQFNVLDASLIAKMEFDLKMTPEERSKENMALFFLGNPDNMKTGGTGNLSQTGAAISAQAFKPRFDRWVDVGKRLLKTGSISLTRGANTVQLSALVAGTDYRIDLENGLLMILSTNTLVSQGAPWTSFIDGDTTTTINFKYGTVILPRFVQGTTPAVGFLRYVGLSAVGVRHSLKLWKVQINPDSALKMLDAGNIAGLSFTGKVYIDDDTGAHSDIPFGDITELNAATSYPS
jgi:hypothetical protein